MDGLCRVSTAEALRHSDSQIETWPGALLAAYLHAAGDYCQTGRW